MSEFIEFELLKKNPKTSIYAVQNLKSNRMIGLIKWYGPWRQYCFFPDRDTIFNMDCMRYIIDYIKELMDARK